MRSYQHVGKGEQTRQLVVLQDLTREIFEKNPFFLLVDVQGHATNVTALQSLDQGFGMNKTAATDVDDYHSRLHSGQRLFIDDVIRFGCQRGMQRNEIAFSRQRLYFRILNFTLRRPSPVRKRVESEDAH